MNRRRRRTVFALDCLEGRLSLDGATASLMLAQAPTSDFVMYASFDAGDVSPDPADGPGLVDASGPGSNDGQLPFLTLSPAPLLPAGSY